MNKKIIVTGSEGLIGKNICKYLKKNKHHVIKIDLKYGHNLTNENDVKKIMIKHGNSDYLINLHGYNDHINKIRKSQKYSKENFNDIFLTNVYSIYLTNKYFIEKTIKPKGIINFASLYSIQAPKHFIYNSPKNLFYVASKFSVVGLTKYFSTMYGKKLNINCIINGGIDYKIPNSFKKKILRHIPKGRMMKIKDLHGIIDLLISGKSDYMNGSSIVLDGGYSSW